MVNEAVLSMRKTYVDAVAEKQPELGGKEQVGKLHFLKWRIIRGDYESDMHGEMTPKKNV